MTKGKDITLSEFLNWLEGIEEFKDKGWHPDAGEWKRIRAKMRCIVQVNTGLPRPLPNVGQMQLHNNNQHPNLPPGITPPPGIPSSIPAVSPSNLVPSKEPTNGGLQTRIGRDGKPVIKTPDIDGAYTESTFS